MDQVGFGWMAGRGGDNCPDSSSAYELLGLLVWDWVGLGWIGWSGMGQGGVGSEQFLWEPAFEVAARRVVKRLDGHAHHARELSKYDDL